MSTTTLTVPEDHWARVESQVTRLGMECRRLQRENQRLVRALADREHQLAQLRAAQRENEHAHQLVARLSSARGQINQRIEDLLTRIDLVEMPAETLAGNDS